MTTRVRDRAVRAAVVIALAGVPLTVSATPAAAAPPDIRIESVSSDNVRSGETVRVRFRATNNGRGTERAFVAVSGGLRCTSGCMATADLRPGQGRSFTATLVAPQVGAGEQSGRNLAVTVRIGMETGFAHKMIMVRGSDVPAPDEPSSGASQVAGRVRDAGGKAVAGATVTVRDSAGHSYRTSSDGEGRFTVRAGDSRPIAAGRVTVSAAKDGYRTARASVQAAAGKAATVRLTLTATPSPAPSSAVAGAPAVAPAPVTGPSTPEATSLGTLRTAGEEGDGLLLFTILGGMLAAVGLGALVMAVTRRRSPDTPEAPAPPPAPAGGIANAPTAVFHTVPPERAS